MGQLAGTTFGIGNPSAYASWGFSPYATQGLGIQPLAQQPYGQPFSTPAIGGYGIGAGQPLQHVLQILQILPQQLQQVQFLQQLQLQHLQQLLQLVPAQLQQLQQLVQIVPQQVQQLQQPYGQGIASPFSFGLAPQPFGGPPAGHVM
jgi:hypothetical protein